MQSRYMPMFITTVFTIAKLWDQPRCPLRDEWIKNMWYIFIMEYYSAIKNNEVSFTGKWMELEVVRLSEIN
jgi:hypothetical protein